MNATKESVSHALHELGLEGFFSLMKNNKIAAGEITNEKARQKNKLINLGVEERLIFEDKASGKDFNREQYQFMRNQVLRSGDLLYIDSLDRLGRNYDIIISEWKYITREINADIVVLDQESIFDSRKFKQQGDIGKLLEDQILSLLSYVAKIERKKIKQRQA